MLKSKLNLAVASWRGKTGSGSTKLKGSGDIVETSLGEIVELFSASLFSDESDKTMVFCSQVSDSEVSNRSSLITLDLVFSLPRNKVHNSWKETGVNFTGANLGTSSQGSFLCISDDQNKRYGNNIYKSKF